MKLFIYSNPSESLRLLEKSIRNYGEANDIECYFKLIEPSALTDQTFFSDEDHYEIENSDAIVTWGTWGSVHPARQWSPGNCKNQNNKQGFKDSVNRFASALAVGYNIPHLVSETATLSRLRLNYVSASRLKSVNPVYYRLGINHWTYAKTTWPKPQNNLSRLKKFETEFQQNYQNGFAFNRHRWKNDRTEHGTIFILPGLEQDPTSTLPPGSWVRKSVEKIRKITNRAIVVKPHPLSSTNYKKILDQHQDIRILESTDKIKDFLEHMYCAVVDNSTSVFELVDAGIPVFCSKVNFAQGLGNTDLDNIENITYASKKKYQSWANQMSYTEYSIHEWNNGEILPVIKSLIK